MSLGVFPATASQRTAIASHPKLETVAYRMTPHTQALARLAPLQLYEHIVDVLEEQIRSGALLPGDRPPAERDLARQLEVGRSSVREAVAALGTRGIVETRAGAGSFIAAAAPELVCPEERPAVADASPSAALEVWLALNHRSSG